MEKKNLSLRFIWRLRLKRGFLLRRNLQPMILIENPKCISDGFVAAVVDAFFN
jgi:hypothetical protein